MWISALLLGILGSFHCVGMCGPIAFLLPVNRQNNWIKAGQIFLYHLGRILAYSTIGVIFGLVGKSFSLFGLQQQLSIAIGVLMILVIVVPSRYLNKFHISRPVYKLISKVKSALGKELKKKTPDTFLTIGFLNGFLPCGLVYMAVFGAVASGNAVQGSAYMALFGMGTIPLMTTAIYISSVITASVKKNIRQILPVLVVLIGCWFIFRGMGLGIPYISPKPAVEAVGSNYTCDTVASEEK